jgi:hypothetical protein
MHPVRLRLNYDSLPHQDEMQLPSAPALHGFGDWVALALPVSPRGFERPLSH